MNKKLDDAFIQHVASIMEVPVSMLLGKPTKRKNKMTKEEYMKLVINYKLAIIAHTKMGMGADWDKILNDYRNAYKNLYLAYEKIKGE